MVASISFFKPLILGDGWSRFGFPHPFVRSQKLISESPATMAILEKNDNKGCVGSSSLSEHDSREERLTVVSPLPNENIKSCESNDNMNNEKPEEDDRHYDYNGSLRNAYRAFLENSVVAALAGDFASCVP